MGGSSKGGGGSVPSTTTTKVEPVIPQLLRGPIKDVLGEAEGLFRSQYGREPTPTYHVGGQKFSNLRDAQVFSRTGINPKTAGGIPSILNNFGINPELAANERINLLLAQRSRGRKPLPIRRVMSKDTRFQPRKMFHPDELEGISQIKDLLPSFQPGALSLLGSANALIDPKDPRNAEMFDLFMAPLKRTFEEEVIPRIGDQAAAIGQAGGGSRGVLEKLAAGERYARAANEARLQQLQLGANLLPVSEELLLRGPQTLLNLGSLQQSRPKQLLEDFARIVSGITSGIGAGQQGTSTANQLLPQTNRLGSAIGGGLTGALAGSSIGGLFAGPAAGAALTPALATSGLGAGVATGATAGSVVPGVGTAIGALLGLLAGGLL